MEALAGWKVVIAGGAGLLGLGLVRAFRMAGATVIVPVRDAEELAALRAHCDDLVSGDLITEEADLTDPQSAAEFSEWIGRNFAGLDVVVVASGARSAWSLAHVDFGTWRRVVREGLAQHFLAIRSLAPWLKERRGVLAHIDADGTVSTGVSPSGPEGRTFGLGAVLDQIGATSIAVIDVVLDTLTLRRLRKSDARAFEAQDIGPYLVQLVDNVPHAGRVRHRLPFRSEAGETP